MCELNRQAIIVDEEYGATKKLTLTELSNKNQTREFIIKAKIGSGTSVIVYEAEYLSGDVWHQCILKELYPAIDGLIRDETTTILRFDENNEDIDAIKKRYENYKKRYLEAYRIQNELRNANFSALNSLQDKWMLSVSISPTLGVYENEYGILYTAYQGSGGIAYDEFNTSEKPMEETLSDILDMIIQTGNTIDAFHRAGYLVLDVKEKNILITGDAYNRVAMQFDFGSFVKKVDLKNFQFNSEVALSFTSTDPAVLLPRELKIFHNHFYNKKISDAERIVKTTLAINGERTDIFLLAVTLFRRLFGFTPESSLITEDGKWEFPIQSEYVSIPLILDKLHDVFNTALAKKASNRYETMSDFVQALKEIRTLSVLENPEDKRRFVENGITYTENSVTKGLLAVYSRKHWEELGSRDGKFFQLMKFSDRFDCRVSLVDMDDNFITPKEAIEKGNRILILGDGGMGKSTALFDYWTEQLTKKKRMPKICLYLDLSRFSSIGMQIKEHILHYGNFTSDAPINLLAYIESYILQKYSITSKVTTMNTAISDPNQFTQLTELHNILSLQTDNAEFVVFLDGYNEILENTDKGVFEDELRRAVATWKNATIVVTSRAITDKKDSVLLKSDEKSIFEQLDNFKFVGISNCDIEKAIMEKKNLNTEEINTLRNDKIWEVLKIPMFLNMYLNLHTDEAIDIHTRGEILDRFITKSEKDVAAQIAKNQPNSSTKSAIRRFVVQFTLPFVANAMDSDRVFLETEYAAIAQITNGNSIYLVSTAGEKQISVYESYTKQHIIADSIGFTLKDYVDSRLKLGLSEEQAMQIFISSDNISDILKIETGYCYNMSDGKIAFTHQYFRDYFAAKHIQNILNAAKALGQNGLTKSEQLQFTKDNGLQYIWSDEVCILLGEIIGDYKNEPEYTEK